MLDIKTAELVKKAIDERYDPFNSPFSLENIRERMKEIPGDVHDGYTVFALQSGNLTVLVRIANFKTCLVDVHAVKFLAW